MKVYKSVKQLFFIVIKLGTKAGLFAKKEEPVVVEGPSEIELLAEIRDLLKEKE